MDNFSLAEYHSLSLNSGDSWSSSADYSTSETPGLPAYASHILNFDPVPTTTPRTLFQGEHYAAEPGHSRHSSYGSRTSFRDDNNNPHINSPFVSGHRSPFLSHHPSLHSKPRIGTPPLLTLEPVEKHWQPPAHEEVFVNVSDLTSSGSSSGNSPTNGFFYEHTRSPPRTSNYEYTGVSPQEYSRPGRYQFSPTRSPVNDSYGNQSPGSTSSASTSSYNDDGSYSDSDSLYRPSPGPARYSAARSRKRVRVQDDDDEPSFAESSLKKSRGRKVPVAPDFIAADVGESTMATALPTIPFGMKKTGSPNKTKRRYVCTYEGCGKCFVRGEHLKRHVKSLHLCEKPHQCPHEGCDKSFSRKDNLKQHMGVFH